MEWATKNAVTFMSIVGKGSAKVSWLRMLISEQQAV